MQHFVFVLYILYIFVYACINSREENVLVGKEPRMLLAVDSVVGRVGWILPYLLLCLYHYHSNNRRRGGALRAFSVAVDILFYFTLKKIILLIKLKKIKYGRVFISPSGHTLLFLNGISIGIPIAVASFREKRYGYTVASLLFIYLYDRLLLITINTYHTIPDILLVVGLCGVWRSAVEAWGGRR